MTIRVALHHRTLYRFDRPTTLSPHVIRLRPAPHTRTPIEAYSLRIRPRPHFLNWQQDAFGNYLARLVFPEPARELLVEVDLVAELVAINPFDFFLEDSAQNAPFSYSAQTRRELTPYLEVIDEGTHLRRWLEGVDRTPRGTVDFLVDVNRRLQRDIAYRIRMEAGVQSCETTLETGSGSCRDSAWLLVQILRHLGLAARFVSGYLVQLTSDEKSLDGPSGPERDFTDLHAWTEVYVPGAGWIGLDPTSGLFAGEGHIPLAATPDAVSAAPISGATSICKVELEFENRVTRVRETPRTTRPYPEEDWIAIRTLGEAVDERLREDDVRLTMGGEPTFVSIDDPDGPEWNFTADSPKKRALAETLVRRIWRRAAPGGVLQRGQGKWYPGEELPRWRYSLFWRPDGIALWRDPAWLADPSRPAYRRESDARAFLEDLALALGVARGNVTAAYEDPFYHAWQEANLPANVDPLDYDLESSRDRRRLAGVLERGLGTPCAHVLPIAPDPMGAGWRSARWPLRRDRLLLVPGDSPAGLRLPLASLPWFAPNRRDLEPVLSPLEARPRLGDPHATVRERVATSSSELTSHDHVRDRSPGGTARASTGSAGEGEWESIPHTALVVEPRDGHLAVFLPPVHRLETFVELIAAIEHVAGQRETPVLLEGYEPPPDPRLRRLDVTPDPGVIEVNVDPSSSWGELVEKTTALYEDARQSRLGTEKFLLDGRHTGTGGGNHVTVGGITPADSPFLRRPDLLRSLVTYWQHHPGLSYLFSSLFIGPTSQAPRIDEARNESLYELEIAFDQIPDAGSLQEGRGCTPWLVDRLLRHLLVDLTGNTHRAEFCIDKLHPVESLSSRLGIVELRGFEMPPHARMSLVQSLLVRALIARFWRKPYHAPLVRWGTALHDRYLLPHWVRADVTEVTRELAEHGLSFRAEWLDPFFEFRFPHYGAVRVRDLELELRGAIEPWPVLGEEVTALGTARSVDSSIERLQIRVTGLVDSRYVVTVNGRRLPLTPTGTHGESVCGVRFVAWKPPSSLHPNLAPDSPLVFDLIDTWNGRAIGGCTYSVSHPGGRSYETLPVNTYEAEGRRISRFWPHGHTPGALEPREDLRELARSLPEGRSFLPEGSELGPLAPPPEEPSGEYPVTLDLRRRPRRTP